MSMPKRDCALLMTAKDDDFWTFDKAVSYYYYAFVNYLKWRDRGIVLAGNYGGSVEERHIKDTGHLDTAYQFGINF